MATSGNFGTSNQYIVYNINVSVNSQNIANNSSNVTVVVNCWRTNSGYTTYGNGTCHCGINNVGYDVGINNSQTITSTPRTLFSKTLDIGHNADGTKTMYVSAKITHDRFSSSDQGFNVTLPTIPRTSSFSLSSNNLEFNQSVTITINRASSSFTHDIYIGFGKTVLSIEYGAGTSKTYTIPNSLMDQIPNTTSGTGSITVYTINGSNVIGAISQQITLNVPSSVVPTLDSISATRIDGSVPAAWQTYVQGKSKCKFTFNKAAGVYGSTIKTFTITGGNYSNASTSNVIETADYLSDSGTITFTGTITDSRGRSASKTLSLTINPYSPPSIKSLTCFRCNQSGKVLDEGTYFNANAVFSYSDVNKKNTLTVNKLSWVRTDGTTTGSGNKTNLTSGTAITLGNGTISASYAWKIIFELKDSLGSISNYTVNLPTGSTTMDFLKGGKGISVGGVASLQETFDCNWKALFRKGITLEDEANSNKTTKIAFDFVNNYLTNAGHPIFDGISCPIIKTTNDSNTTQYSARFPNGFQINFMRQKVQCTVNDKRGALYVSNILSPLPNYTQAFSEVPFVVKYVDEASVDRGWLNGCKPATTTWPGEWEILREIALPTASTFWIYAISFGKWK